MTSFPASTGVPRRRRDSPQRRRFDPYLTAIFTVPATV